MVFLQIISKDVNYESEHTSPQRKWLSNGRGSSLDHQTNSIVEDSENLDAASQAARDEEHKNRIINAAQGREIHHIQVRLIAKILWCTCCHFETI